MPRPWQPNLATARTTKPAVRLTRTETVDDYVAAAPKDKRAVLTKLRKTIRATAPRATEGLGYGMAMFRHPNGQPLVYFAYWKDHCALYGAGLGFIEAHAAELKPYRLSKGTIRFAADKPLPDRLVAKIVKARYDEVEKAG